MKKLFLATTALAGFATIASPALADGLELDLEGFYRGYALFTDNDEPTGADGLREVDVRHDAEIHFTGKTTLDNGLTVGVHAEVELASPQSDDDQTEFVDEVYAYFSGSWGRFNVGQEDGIAYLLQVAAPSADSNIDGLRTYVQAVDTSVLTTAGVNSIVGQDNRLVFDYAQDTGEFSEKLTYITPNFSGFQAGLSWAPEVTGDPNTVTNAVAAPAADNTPGDLENLIELAARWDGEFEGVGASFGAGYSTAETEVDAGAGAVGSDDLEEWNVGLNLDFSGFELGAAYTESNNAIDNDGDTEIFVIGAGWNNGPYSVGVSYFDSETEVGAGVQEVDVDRFTFGGTYAYGPGMTFRGAVAFGEIDADSTANDRDFTQVTIGTEINF